MRSLLSSSQPPLVSPIEESRDPFAESSDDASSNAGALPVYLSTLANHPTFRNARQWKRFVHVRLNDLESVRVERTIKRVRSDVEGNGPRLDSTPQLLPLPVNGDSMSKRDFVVDSDAVGEASVAASSLRKESSATPEADEDEIQRISLNQTNGLDAEAVTNFDTDAELPSGDSGLNTPTKDKKRLRKVSASDFETLSVLGKGYSGKVRDTFLLVFLLHSS